jgi:hypothetical protein
MRNWAWDVILLLVLLAGLFWIRMELSTSTPALSYDSYLTVRNVEHIHDTGSPLRDDQFSITGQKRISNPIFDYFLAGLIFISPAMYKVLPNLFMILLLIPVYFITRRITGSPITSFMAVLLAASGPIVFASYLNTPSEAPLAIFLFLAIIAMLHDPDSHLFTIILFTILLTFLSPVIFILALTLLTIIIILRVEGFGIDPRINELFFFTLLLAVWFYVIIFKEALFSQGVQVIWQNLPTELANISFGNITLLTTLYGLGVVTFLLGTFGMYHALFENRERNSYAIVASALAVTVALLLQIIPVEFGLVLLTLFLSVMAAYGLLITLRYMRRTKTPWIVYPFVAILGVFFIFSAILPALVNARIELQDSPTAEDIASLQQLALRLPNDAILLTTVKEGAVTQYYSERKTVTDNDFLLINKGDELVNDIDSVYTSRFRTPVVGRAEKLGFTHILLTRVARERYGRERLYSADAYCLPSETVGNIVLYRIVCGGDE